MWFIPPPPTTDRDIALGRYMSEWGNLEFKISILFYILIGTDVEIASILFSVGFQAKTLIDLLKAFGQSILLESEQKELKGLCKRYNELVLKRNKIVHSRWLLDSVKNDPTAAQWVRICFPIDPEVSKQIFNKSNQKIRSKYRFTIKQLITATEDVKSLTIDISQFGGIVSRRLEPLPEES